MNIYLNAVRTNAQMTQEEWAEKLGVTKQTVANWEKGLTVPKLDTVKKMSEMSGVPVECIFLPSRTTI